MGLSWAFIKKHGLAVLFVLVVFVGGWEYLALKNNALEAQKSEIRERGLALAKERAAFAESLAILRLERAQIVEERSQLEQLQQELKSQNQLLDRERRKLAGQEKLADRRARLDRNLKLYSENYAELDPGDETRACDLGRDERIAGGKSLLRLISADAKALGDMNLMLFVGHEFSKFNIMVACRPEVMKLRDTRGP